MAEITGTCHHTWLIFVLLVETEFHHVGQASFEFLTSESYSIAQARVQQHDLGSLQPLPPRFKRFSCLSLQKWGGLTMLARLVSNSWPQVIHPPQPPKVLRLQVGATVPGHNFEFCRNYEINSNKVRWSQGD
ncbi:hypothetical protein AAY473_015471, partial [Plecturocebus cupreus]